MLSTFGEASNKCTNKAFLNGERQPTAFVKNGKKGPKLQKRINYALVMHELYIIVHNTDTVVNYENNLI